MHKVLIITIAVLFANLTAIGQNLFLIGEKSYPCTSTIKLASNSNYNYDDLDVFLAKEGKSGFFAVSRKCMYDEEFTGKIIIYLEDGNVLTCGESEVSEKVDDRAKTVYSLTADQLNKLKTSNIHTVKYTMIVLHENENYSASNTGVQTSTLISGFFKE